MHSFIVSIIVSLLMWTIIHYFIFPISLKHYIIIEFAMVFGELFSNFVKEQMGVKVPDNEAPNQIK